MLSLWRKYIRKSTKQESTRACPVECQGKSKAEAKQRAGIYFLEAFINNQLVNSNEAKLNVDIVIVQPGTNGNAISKLYEFKQKNPGIVSEPVFEFKKSGPDHDPIFACIAQITINKEVLICTVEDKNKKNAKERSVIKLLELIKVR